MRIDVIGKHLDITDAIREYAQHKAERLTKVFDGTQQIRFYLEQTKDKAGDFKVEVAVDVVKHKDFIATCLDKDLYAAIDSLADKLDRQVLRYKDRVRAHPHDALKYRDGMEPNREAMLPPGENLH